MRKLLCSLALLVGAGALVAVVAPTAPARQKDEKKDTKKDAKDDKPGTIEVYQAKDGWRFRVVGADGKSIAIGVQSYTKKEECLAAIEALKATLAKAKTGEPKEDKK